MSDDNIAARSDLCHVWILTLKSGERFGFSDHDRPLTFEGVVCEPSSGFSGSDAETRLGFAVDNHAVQGVLSDDRLSGDHIDVGDLAGAEVKAFRVAYTDPSAFLALSAGHIGSITRQGDVWEAEILGEASLLERSTGRVFSRLCDATFGDARCGLNKADFPADTQCPRTFAACRARFGNSLNFRGFPYLLGDDALTAAPEEGEPRDGGSRYA